MTKMTRMSGLLEALAMRFANQGGWRPSNKISNEAFVWILLFMMQLVFVNEHGFVMTLPLLQGCLPSSERIEDVQVIRYELAQFSLNSWMMINAIHFWDLILFKFFLINTHWILIVYYIESNPIFLKKYVGNVASSGLLASPIVFCGHSSQVIKIGANMQISDDKL